MFCGLPFNRNQGIEALQQQAMRKERQADVKEKIIYVNNLISKYKFLDKRIIYCAI